MYKWPLTKDLLSQKLLSNSKNYWIRQPFSSWTLQRKTFQNTVNRLIKWRLRIFTAMDARSDFVTLVIIPPDFKGSLPETGRRHRFPRQWVSVTSSDPLEKSIIKTTGPMPGNASPGSVKKLPFLPPRENLYRPCLMLPDPRFACSVIKQHIANL